MNELLELKEKNELLTICLQDKEEALNQMTIRYLEMKEKYLEEVLKVERLEALLSKVRARTTSHSNNRGEGREQGARELPRAMASHERANFASLAQIQTTQLADEELPSNEVMEEVVKQVPPVHGRVMKYNRSRSDTPKADMADEAPHSPKSDHDSPESTTSRERPEFNSWKRIKEKNSQALLMNPPPEVPSSVTIPILNFKNASDDALASANSSSNSSRTIEDKPADSARSESVGKDKFPTPSYQRVASATATSPRPAMFEKEKQERERLEREREREKVVEQLHREIHSKAEKDKERGVVEPMRSVSYGHAILSPRLRDKVGSGERERFNSAHRGETVKESNNKQQDFSRDRVGQNANSDPERLYRETERERSHTMIERTESKGPGSLKVSPRTPTVPISVLWGERNNNSKALTLRQQAMQEEVQFGNSHFQHKTAVKVILKNWPSRAFVEPLPQPPKNTTLAQSLLTQPGLAVGMLPYMKNALPPLPQVSQGKK